MKRAMRKSNSGGRGRAVCIWDSIRFRVVGEAERGGRRQ